MIDYAKIARGVEHYSRLGYEYIEVPWIVSKDAIDITKPPESQYFDTVFGHLVGSGEQSFLHIYDRLKSGHKYQCVTPCFRDEVFDELHQMWFMKLELIEVLDKDAKWADALEDMVDDAWDFFAQFANEDDMEEVDYADSLDIEINRVEVGSYGIRTYEGCSWVFGTGVAEPRLSMALKA